MHPNVNFYTYLGVFIAAPALVHSVGTNAGAEVILVTFVFKIERGANDRKVRADSDITTDSSRHVVKLCVGEFHWIIRVARLAPVRTFITYMEIHRNTYVSFGCSTVISVIPDTEQPGQGPGRWRRDRMRGHLQGRLRGHLQSIFTV